MELTATTFLIVCPLLFLAGLIDAIGGGGGLISLPAYLFAGLGIETASAQTKIINLTTNATALVVFLINGQVLIPLALAGAACNMVGGFIGAKLMLKNTAKIVRPTILLVLVIFLIKVIFDLLLLVK